MLLFEGTYNTAYVMIDSIDEATERQIYRFLNHKAFAHTHIAIMPDCHAGKGAVIGFTMNIGDYIIPNIVGVDIGCGILSACFKLRSPDLPALDTFIKKYVPSGMRIHKTAVISDPAFTEEILFMAQQIDMDNERALNSIGTLGGGNHFIELGKDSQGRYWLTVHSGSRNLGLQIARFYQQKAKAQLAEAGTLTAEDAELEYLFTESNEGQAYLQATYFAQRYAAANRRKIIEIIAEFFGKEPIELRESVHNFIGADGIIRKGATSAQTGECVILPFNMRDGFAFCTGSGNPAYNFSAPHGAGRIMSRTAARSSLSVKSFQKEMKNAGIYTSTASKGTLDEAPDVYKSKTLILKHIQQTVTVNDFVKPVYNFKAGY
ncbi:MAG: RtcB family protein [Treponema sp.]